MALKRRQVITWIMLFIVIKCPLEQLSVEFLSKWNVGFKDKHLKMLSAFCPRINVVIKRKYLMQCLFQQHQYRSALGVKVTLITKRYNDSNSIKGWPMLQLPGTSITNTGFFIHLWRAYIVTDAKWESSPPSTFLVTWLAILGHVLQIWCHFSSITLSELIITSSSKLPTMGMFMKKVTISP